MSTYETNYSNTTTDLIAVVPELESYDQKKLIINWVQHSGQVYRADSVGFISQLYKDGQDLGAAQSALVDVDTDDEWYYDSASDVVYVDKASATPNECRMEAGVDWETLKTRINNEQAERIRSFLPFPILSRKGVGTQSASSRNWDWVIIKSNAILTTAELVRDKNPELADELERRVIDPIDQSGLLDRLKRGEYHLWNQKQNQNGLTPISTDASTTGDIVDVKGESSVDWDIIKIVIDTGGTLSSGSASSLKYSTYGKDDTGIKISSLVSNETVTGGWDAVGHGMYVRFSPGVYVANDEWELEVNGGKYENSVMKTVQLIK